jgi:DNA-binding transcriptional LysR family regulator
MDRLKALEIFKAIAEQGSFVKGADSLNLSKCHVSRAVQDLEALLGAKLLQRSTRRLSLTSMGQTVLAHAKTLLASYDALTAMSNRDASEVAGSIRLVAPASYCVRRLGASLAAFVAEHPQVRVDLRLANDAIDVIEQRAELALCAAGTVPATLIARRVSSTPMGLYASPFYLARRGTPEHPSELPNHDCLVYAQDDAAGAMDWTFAHVHTGERRTLSAQGALNCNNPYALVEAAVHGAGLARLPHFVAEAAVQRGELMTVLPHWRSAPLDMLLAYASRSFQPLRVRKLIEHLAVTLDEPVAAASPPPRRASPVGRCAVAALKPLPMPVAA